MVAVVQAQHPELAEAMACAAVDGAAGIHLVWGPRSFRMDLWDVRALPLLDELELLRPIPPALNLSDLGAASELAAWMGLLPHPLPRALSRALNEAGRKLGPFAG